MRVNRNLTEASYAAGNKLKESTQHLVANTGRKTDNSKRVIKYTDAGVFCFGDGSFENWVPDSQKQKN